MLVVMFIVQVSGKEKKLRRHNMFRPSFQHERCRSLQVPLPGERFQRSPDTHLFMLLLGGMDHSGYGFPVPLAGSKGAQQESPRPARIATAIAEGQLTAGGLSGAAGGAQEWHTGAAHGASSTPLQRALKAPDDWFEKKHYTQFKKVNEKTMRAAGSTLGSKRGASADRKSTSTILRVDGSCFSNNFMHKRQKIDPPQEDWVVGLVLSGTSNSQQTAPADFVENKDFHCITEKVDDGTGNPRKSKEGDSRQDFPVLYNKKRGNSGMAIAVASNPARLR